MTNRKFKPKNLQNNLLAHVVINANNELVAILLLALNELFGNVFYEKSVRLYIEHHQSTTRSMNSFSDDGIFDYKSKELGEICGVDDEICKQIVEFQIVRRHGGSGDVVGKNLRLLYENFKFMLITLCEHFGFGQIRLERLEDFLLRHYYDEPFEELRQRFDIDLEVPLGEVDYSRYERKKEKPASYEDGVRGRELMEAFKAYENEVLTKRNISSDIEKEYLEHREKLGAREKFWENCKE